MRRFLLASAVLVSAFALVPATAQAGCVECVQAGVTKGMREWYKEKDQLKEDITKLLQAHARQAENSAQNQGWQGVRNTEALYTNQMMQNAANQAFQGYMMYNGSQNQACQYGTAGLGGGSLDTLIGGTVNPTVYSSPSYDPKGNGGVVAGATPSTATTAPGAREGSASALGVYAYDDSEIQDAVALGLWDGDANNGANRKAIPGAGNNPDGRDLSLLSGDNKLLLNETDQKIASNLIRLVYSHHLDPIPEKLLSASLDKAGDATLATYSGKDAHQNKLMQLASLTAGGSDVLTKNTKPGMTQLAAALSTMGKDVKRSVVDQMDIQARLAAASFPARMDFARRKAQSGSVVVGINTTNPGVGGGKTVSLGDLGVSTQSAANVEFARFYAFYTNSAYPNRMLDTNTKHFMETTYNTGMNVAVNYRVLEQTRLTNLLLGAILAQLVKPDVDAENALRARMAGRAVNVSYRP